MLASPLEFNPGQISKQTKSMGFVRSPNSASKCTHDGWLYISIPALEMLDLGLGFEIRSKKEGRRRKRPSAEIKAWPPALGFTPLLLQNVPELGKSRRVLSNHSASLGQAGIWRELHLCSCLAIGLRGDF